jgi:hypothetical protein
LTFSGRTLTFREYSRVEHLYVVCVERLLDTFGYEWMLVGQPRLGIPLPGWLPGFRNGTRLGREHIFAVLRGMLRGVPVGCVFESADGLLRVTVGFDYYLMVEVPPDRRASVGQAVPPGLFVLAEQDPPVEAYVATLADGAFWSGLKEEAAATGECVWILEQWAHGCWGERWFLAAADHIDDVRAAVGPNSIIRAGFGVEFEVVEPGRYFDESTVASAGLSHLRAFAYPPGGSELFAWPLDSTAPERVTSHLMAQPAVGVFRPDRFFEGGLRFEAVVPDDNGLPTARWLGGLR